MAAAAQDKSLFAVKGLLTRIDVTARHVVVDFHRHIYRNAAQGVDYSFEAIKVDFRIVVDGDACQLGNRVNGAGGTAECIGSIDFLRAVVANGYLRIARDGNKRNFLFPWVDTRQNHRVGSI